MIGFAVGLAPAAVAEVRICRCFTTELSEKTEAAEAAGGRRRGGTRVEEVKDAEKK